MKVQEIMERAGISETGRAIAYIKDGLEEMNLISSENIVKGSTVKYTASTLGFTDANPDTITDSASGLVNAGFIAGMKVLVDGSTSNDTDESDNTSTGYYTIASVAAGALVLDASDALTVESAGESITLRGQTLNYMDVIKDKRYYTLPSEAIKITDIRVKNHLNTKDQWRSIPRMIGKPVNTDTDEI